MLAYQSITLPTGWVQERTKDHIMIVLKDLDSGSHALQETSDGIELITISDGIVQSDFNEHNKTKKKIYLSLKRLENDAYAMRSDLSQFLTEAWNNEIVPHIK